MLTLENLMRSTEFMELLREANNWEWIIVGMYVFTYIVMRLAFYLIPPFDEQEKEMKKLKKESRIVGIVIITLIMIYAINPRLIERFEPYYITEYRTLPVTGKEAAYVPTRRGNLNRAYLIEVKEGHNVAEFEVEANQFHKFEVGDELILIRTNKDEEEKILTSVRSLKQQLKASGN